MYIEVLFSHLVELFDIYYAKMKKFVRSIFFLIYACLYQFLV